MKTTTKLLLAALLIALITSTYFMLKIGSFIEINLVETSGIYTEKTLEIDDFNSLLAENSVIVTFYEAGENKIVIEADTALYKYLVAEVKDEQLILNLDTPLPEHEKALIKVYSDIPKHIKIDKGAKLKFSDSITTDTMYVDLQRGSKMNIRADITHLECYQWEDTKVNIKGKGSTLKVRAQHRSTFNGQDYIASDADVTSTVGSEVFVFVTGSLNVKATEAGIVNYRGNPQLKETNIHKDGRLVKVE